MFRPSVYEQGSPCQEISTLPGRRTGSVNRKVQISGLFFTGVPHARAVPAPDGTIKPPESVALKTGRD